MLAHRFEFPLIPFSAAPMNASLQSLLALVLFAGLVLSPVPGQDTPAAPAAPAAQEAPATPEPPETPAAPAKPRASKSKRRHSETVRGNGTRVHVSADDDGDRVSIGKSAELPAGETAKDFVVILGDGVVDGTVEGDLVVVLGNATVNGTVKGDAVNIGGGLHLGPTAVVEGDAVGVLGGVSREPGAQIHGKTVPIPIPGFEGFNSERLTRWFGECVILMRPLSLRVGWVWPIWGAFLGFYLLLTILFPRAVEATANVYAERTASSFLMGVLSVPLVALIALLLSFILMSPFFIAAVLAGELIGKAALLFQLGRLLGRSANRTLPPLLAVMAGGLLMTLLYLTPFLGMLVHTVTNFWAVGAATLALSARFRRESPKPSASFTPPPTPPSGPDGGPGFGPGPKFTPVVPVAPGTPAVSSAALGIVGASALAVSGTPMPASELNVSLPTAPDTTTPTGSSGPVDSTAASSTFGAPPLPAAEPPRTPIAESVPPRSTFTAPGFSGASSTAPLSGDLALPRAGFGLRLVASMLDWVLVAFILNNSFLHGLPNFLLWMLAAAAFSGLYVWKGATLGGLVLRLKVVRLDGRRLDFPCALVRTCTTVFSVLCGGIGWLWCIWDKDHQAWHDMLAGTVVVRTEKVQPLV